MPPPNFPGKNEYLYYVEAQDCVKDEVKWRHGFQQVKKILDTKGGNHKKKKRQKPKSNSDKLTKSIATARSQESTLTKVERKALLQERKRTLKATWSSMSDNSDDEWDTLDAPSSF